MKKQNGFRTALFFSLSLLFLLCFPSLCEAQGLIRVFAQGDSSRLSSFVESCKKEFAENGMKLELVRPDEGFDYTIVVAQESSIGGAAAAVIVLDNKGMFVASVVRSGRMSGKGAFDASAKQIAKKLSVLRIK